MKTLLRTSSLLLASFYLLISLGFGLKAHYCHGDLSSISYIASVNDCDCGDPSMEMKCCSNKEQFFQFDEELVLNSNKEVRFELLSAGESIQVINISTDQLELGDDLNLEVIPDQGPPLFIKHTSLILYA